MPKGDHSNYIAVNATLNNKQLSFICCGEFYGNKISNIYVTNDLINFKEAVGNI